jgi:ABC-2 family transporter
MATTQIAPAASQRLLPPETGRAGFGDALRSEFTKIKSTRSTYWTLLALVVVCVGIGALASAGAASHANQISKATFDATQQSLAGLYVGQLVIAVLGALTITSEYSTGMIRTTLSVQPRRGVVFAAKALVFATVSLIVGLVASFGSFFLGQALMSGHHLSVTLGDPNVLRAVIGGALFLTACGMLAYGLGAILRHTAGAITAAIGRAVAAPTCSRPGRGSRCWPGTRRSRSSPGWSASAPGTPDGDQRGPGARSFFRVPGHFAAPWGPGTGGRSLLSEIRSGSAGTRT